MNEETQTLLMERFSDVSVRAWRDRKPHYGPIVKFETAAWTYTIAETVEGFAIQPENNSPRYAEYVELLLDCLIELAHKQKARSPSDDLA
jgi:hypothetical protein